MDAVAEFRICLDATKHGAYRACIQATNSRFLQLLTTSRPIRQQHRFGGYLIRHCGMTHVRTPPFYPQSNGKIERWHQSLKRECIRLKTPTNLEEVREVVAKFVAHYNHKRYHAGIGYIAPVDKLSGTAPLIF